MKKTVDCGHKISIKVISIAFTVIIMILCILLALNTLEMHKYNKKSIEVSESHISCTDIAIQFKLGSDILTEQVRLFAETGNTVHMDSFFEEMNTSKHREKALEHLHELSHVHSAEKIENAMLESILLTKTEFYSMKLTAVCYGISESKLPDEVRNVELTPYDSKLTIEEIKKKARSVLFDKTYIATKDLINDNVSGFMDDIVKTSEYEYEKINAGLKKCLILQRVLIISVILIMIFVMGCMNRFLINPLVGASKNIKNNMPIYMPVFLEETNALGSAYNNLREYNTELVGKLKEIANKDALTGLGSRFAYNDYIREICGEKKQMLMFLFDVNGLRNINNSEGHAKGDRILVETAECIKKVFGIYEYENCFRVGGDEFVSFIECKPEECVQNYISLFKNELKKHDVSVSVGYAYEEDMSAADINKMFNDADTDMYKGKYGKGV